MEGCRQSNVAARSVSGSLADSGAAPDSQSIVISTALETAGYGRADVEYRRIGRTPSQQLDATGDRCRDRLRRGPVLRFGDGCVAYGAAVARIHHLRAVLDAEA